MAKRKTVGDALRKAMKASGLSTREIVEGTKLSQPTITEFLRDGDVDLRLKNAEAIADVLGMKIVLVAKGE